jgi:hypothetical protein
MRSQTVVIFREICRIKQLFGDLEMLAKAQFSEFSSLRNFSRKMGKTIIESTLVVRSSVLGSRDLMLLRIYKSFNKSIAKRVAW